MTEEINRIKDSANLVSNVFGYIKTKILLCLEADSGHIVNWI